jgi:hypothetical protein
MCKVMYKVARRRDVVVISASIATNVKQFAGK